MSETEDKVSIPSPEIQKKVKKWLDLDEEIATKTKEIAILKKQKKEIEDELKSNLKDGDEFEIGDQIITKSKEMKTGAINKDIFMAALKEEVTKDQSKIDNIMMKAETLRPTNVKVTLKREKKAK